MIPEFSKFNSIARLRRPVFITEKLDGTNATVYITDVCDEDEGYVWANEDLRVYAGSRDGWISVDKDHYGFAEWVRNNAEQLIKLGTGWFRGEWWGRGINRGYGLSDRRFSLFNAQMYCAHNAVPGVIPSMNPLAVQLQQPVPPCCGVVPLLYYGNMRDEAIDSVIEDLRLHGSKAAPGFMSPEGIVIYHEHGSKYFKQTLEDDDIPKAVAEKRKAAIIAAGYEPTEQ